MQNINTLLNSCWWNYLNNSSRKKIQYLSPIAGSKPGWYFWLEGNQGVFELLLSDCNTEGDREQSSFALKYYPSPEEDVFDTFSCAEQVVRLSDFFDNSPIKSGHNGSECACSQIGHGEIHICRNKGFPRFHARKQINSSLFVIGKIDFILHSGKLLETSLTCQDKIIQYAVEGINVPQQDGTSLQVVEPGSIDRNIPAWTIGWEFYEILVKDIFAKLGLYPINSDRDIRPGFLYYQEKGGEIWFAVSDSVTRITHTHYF